MNSSHYFTFVIFLSFIFGSNITINDNIFSVKANKIDNSLELTVLSGVLTSPSNDKYFPSLLIFIALDY